ncbi:MAG: YkvA family protein [Gemmatimonadaceae bacterium]
MPSAVLHDSRSTARRVTGVLALITHFPAYLELVFGMLRDSRVAKWDRFLVVGSIVYLFSPFDILPDIIPIVGQIDDLFLVVMSLSRMFDRASREVTLSHWSREPGELDPAALRQLLYFASLFATARRRRRLRRLAGVRSGA